MSELKVIELLPVLNSDIQAKGSEMLHKYREDCQRAKDNNKPLPKEPKLPEGFVGMKQGQFLVWSKINELVEVVNGLIKQHNES